jgi:osmoprotectant transport system ATP-binding protein
VRPVTSKPSPVFELRAVSISFGPVRALQEVSLEVPAGKTTVLLGPSGSGKSTALRALLGLVQPEGGQVFFQGEPLTSAAAPSLRRRMGYGVQGGGLFPHLTAKENVSLPARMLRWEGARIEDRLESLMTLTQLPHHALQGYPTELSGGQAQRVALMRALMLDPEVLLLDEPLGALDPETRFDLQRDLQGIFGKLGKTVVLVTHDLSEAYFLGDRWAVLREGKLVQQGTPAQVLQVPADAFVSRFIRAQRGLPIPEAERG